MLYLLSIVIPTRNRQYCALAAVRQIYSITDERVQIVVTDNSDDDSLNNDLKTLHYSERVKYHYTRERIPVVDNYAKGIDLSDGEYICCIGDDDGVMRYIVEFVEWIKIRDIEAVSWDAISIYFWPGVTKNCKTGRLFIDKHNTDYVEYRSPLDDLTIMIKQGGCSWGRLKVVRAYHGIVKKECYNRIKKITGRYCGGLAPDAYLATALSIVVKEALFIGIPLTIYGACKESASGEGANRTAYRELSKAPHLIGQPYTWSAKVPEVYSDFTILADSILHALDDIGAVELADLFSLKMFTYNCLNDFPLRYKKVVKKFYYENNGSRYDLYKIYFSEYIRSLSSPRRLAMRLPGELQLKLRVLFGSSILLQTDIPDITLAEDAAYKHLGKDAYKYIDLLSERTERH